MTTDHTPDFARLIDVQHDGDITANHEVYYGQWKQPEDTQWITMNQAHGSNLDATEHVRKLLNLGAYQGVDVRVVRIRTRQTLTVLQQRIWDAVNRGERDA